MPEYLAPGIYAEETEIGATPIEGVSTSMVGFLSPPEMRPERQRLIKRLEQFKRGGS
jgi:phage tail sheath protein FI